MIGTYPEPVSKLIKLGRPGHPWLDYPALGITREHIPDLIRLMEDEDFSWLEPLDDLPQEEEDLPDWYAQIHAWRALGQLKAEEAIAPLIGMLYQIDEEDFDWLSGDAPEVFAMIGGAAVEPLAAYLAEEENLMYARSAAASGLAEIGQAHPEERERCIRAIAAVLERYEDNDEGFNGFLIGDLVDLKAVEQIELIKQAFEADAVDEMVGGDVEDVQVELGLLEKRLTPQRPWRLDRFAPGLGEISSSTPDIRKADKKQKNKRKQEKKSRKKNRKRR